MSKTLVFLESIIVMSTLLRKLVRISMFIALTFNKTLDAKVLVYGYHA
jgi:hypothetical protein